jgi:hypothetical protein
MSEKEMINYATELGLEEELVSYAKQIQRQLGSEGDTADWIDCLEMAYNELILKEIYS